MLAKKQVHQTANNSLISIILHRYLPYWPLFMILVLGLFTLALIITRYLKPVYKVSATLVINDEQKGIKESETLRSLNIYAANKIVENEVEVLKSKTLMQEVVKQLYLYAPVSEKGRIKPAPAYLTSPISVEAYDPEKVKPLDEVAFEYDEKTQQVKVNNQYYPLNVWATFPFGIFRFVKNRAKKYITSRSMYFSLYDARSVGADLCDNLEVDASSKLSSVVNITFTDVLPERGEDIVNQLLHDYNKASLENNNKLASSSLSFITERVRLIESELDSLEKRIQDYRATHGIVDLSRQGAIYLESVANNDRKVAELNTQMAVLNQIARNIEYGTNKTGIVPTTLITNDAVLNDLLVTLNNLELQYTNQRTKKGDNNPVIVSMANEMKKIRLSIENIVRSLQGQMQASLDIYNRSSALFNAELKTIPERERQLLNLTRQQTFKNTVYALLLQRREEAQISSNSSVADSRIVDAAESGPNRVNSKKLMLLVSALILAFVLGIGYVFVKEGLAKSILFRSELAMNTSIPVMGEITLQNGQNTGNLIKAGDTILSNQFQHLSAALGLYTRHVKKQKLLITSSLPNEGKTFVCYQLALNLAKAEQKVIIIDLNLIHPETTTSFDLKGATGMIDYLQGKTALQQLIKKTDIGYLDILPAGAGIKNTTALLLNEKLDELFLNLEKLYDFILIDAPPIELATDAFILSKYADTTLYIVRHAVTPKGQLQKLGRKEILKTMKDVVIVFNGIKGRGFLKSYYGIGYGYGYENVFSGKKENS